MRGGDRGRPRGAASDYTGGKANLYFARLTLGHRARSWPGGGGGRVGYGGGGGKGKGEWLFMDVGVWGRGGGLGEAVGRGKTSVVGG